MLATMDESVLLDLLECPVCLERLDASAKVLPCQHTFCRRCLQGIVGSRGELRCPECRTLVECAVDELPSNILLVRLLDGIKQRPRGAANGSAGAAARAHGGGTRGDQGAPGAQPQRAQAKSTLARELWANESKNVNGQCPCTVTGTDDITWKKKNIGFLHAERTLSVLNELHFMDTIIF